VPGEDLTPLLDNAWALFDIIVKSLTLQLHYTGQLCARAPVCSCAFRD
jgi:hypothetical protein